MRAPMIGLTLLLAAAAPAAAQGKDAQAKAKALYDSGLKHYNLAEYPEAIKDWKEAYSLTKRPLLLFNIGQAYRLSGDCKLAMTFYDSYQREEPSPKNQDELDQAIELCATAKVTTPPKPEPTPPEPTPSDTVAEPPVPDDGGGQAPVSDPDPAPLPTTTGGGMRKIGIGVGALGVVLGGVGVYFAMDSAKQADKLDGFDAEWGAEQMEIESKGKSSATRAWIFGGVGIVAIVAGGVMYAIGGPKAVESSSLAIVPTRGGAAFGYSLRF